MTGSRLKRLEALEAVRRPAGMEVERALNFLNDLQREMGACPSFDAWLAHREQRSREFHAAPRCADAEAYDAALDKLGAAPEELEEERKAWRRARESYLYREPGQ